MQHTTRTALSFAALLLVVASFALQLIRIVLMAEGGVSSIAVVLLVAGGVITAVLLVDRHERRAARGFIREVETLRSRRGSQGLVIPVWLYDSPEQLTPFALRPDPLPVGMVLAADETGLEFYSEEDERLARVPWEAVSGLRRESRFNSPNPISAEVIRVDLSSGDGPITLYPGKPKNERMRWLRGEGLDAAIDELNSLRRLRLLE